MRSDISEEEVYAFLHSLEREKRQEIIINAFLIDLKENKPEAYLMLVDSSSHHCTCKGGCTQ